MDLADFFNKNPRAAIAFSGGVDSSYLLYAAKKCRADVRAYYVRSQFQPQFELDDAKRLAEAVGVPMRILPADVLASGRVTANPADRCYYCKQIIFGTIQRAASADGYSLLLDGTNASDTADDRPGMRAIRELSVLSPLRLCGLTKDEIRRRSREAGLPTWDKPSYACLATRIPAGEHITQDKLTATEKSEAFLHSLGFHDFRVRMKGGTAKIQVPEEQMERVLRHREEILRELQKYYSAVTLDLCAR